MQTKFGSYTGTGVNDLAITGVGFQPDVVIVKRANTGDTAFFRTASMATNNSMTLRGDSGLVTTGIKTFTSDGFTLGTGGEVNANGVTYYYSAFKKTSANDFDYGSYTGNGTDNRDITLQSDFPFTWLVIKGNLGRTGAYRNKDVSGDNTHAFYSTGYNNNQIQSMSTSTGSVQLGTSDFVNSNTITYYWFGFKEVAGFCSSFTYTGNGVDSTNISIPGTTFQPGFVWIKRQDASDPRMRTSAYSGDSSQSFDGATETNSIQGFNTTGFQVGTNSQVNNNTSTYHTLAIKEGTSGSSTVSAGSQTGSFSIPAVTAIGAALVTASVLSAALSVPAVTARGAASVDAAAQTNTLTIPAPTVSGAAQVSPGAVSGSLSLPAATVSGGGANALVDPVTGTLSIPASTVSAGANFTAGSVSAAVSVPSHAAGGAGSTTAELQSATLSISSPTVTGAASTSPGALSGSLTVPAHTVAAPTIVTPNPVSAGFTLPAVTLRAGASINVASQTVSASLQSVLARGRTWTSEDKPATTWSQSNKPVTSFSQPSKPSSTWTYPSKPTF